MIKYIISLILILILVALIVVGIVNYNSRYSDTPDKESFSFLNQFPYELQDNSTMKYNFAFRMLASLFGAVFASFGIYLFYFRDIYLYKSLAEYISGIIFIVVGIAMYLSFVLTIKNYKVHLINTSILFSFTMINYIIVGIYILTDISHTYSNGLAYMLFVFAILMLLSLIFAPLKRWAYLEKEDKDGTIHYFRKKLSILPFMEWVFIVSNVLLVILLTLF